MNENIKFIDKAALKQNNAILLNPGAKLSTDVISAIKEMNAGKPDHVEYARRVRTLFNLQPITVDEKKKLFLSGFIEGEGSVSIGIKKNPNPRFGIEVDPCFNITQHINGVKHLYLALEIFQTGRIRYKAGSNATLVFIIEPRRSLQEKVVPFLNKYVYPYCAETKRMRYMNFEKMLNLFDQGAHLNAEGFVNEILPLWHSMRMQRGYQGETFPTLHDAQMFVQSTIRNR